ncbi:MAG: NADH-quinone oxidoreductase subunit NuoH [Microthrixaceae bacterium]|nr:NADH-quinone oxidoreductase subunit NuoH [Microthrixaceae bacterium]MCO5312165.1 NADH-quinone oxidoreductase subunit NuoH [Microthrixaceae bacterium]HPB46016.1 NADH-quinone oxidoreductase subunit NuoH [Microthrixaceae bacterium]
MIALDPLLNNLDLTGVLVMLAKVLVAFGILMTSVILMIWFERKLHADFSNRLGPRWAGPFGVLQTLADGMKIMFKSDLIPDQADRAVFKYAPLLSLVPAFIVFSVIPIGGNFNGDKAGMVEIAGRQTMMQVADPHMGVLVILAASSLAIYGIMLAGWSSGSKYPLLGSVRASAQMVSYEAALGLSVLAVLLNSESLSTNAIVNSQSTWGWNAWATGVIPFVIFVIAATAEMNRPPFDLVEAEQELVGGFHTEYAGFRFAIFYLAEFMNVVTMSTIIVTLFLGGPSGPDFGVTGWVSDYVFPVIWFLLKTLFMLVVFVQFRTTLPRLRYDQLMDLGWKIMIPLALGWFLLLAGLKVAQDEGWNQFVVGLVSVLVIFVGAALLSVAVRTARYRREVEKVGA